jgi:hypothetical protein
VMRVDTDGRVRILFPESPWDNNYARGDRRYEIRAPGARQAFVIDDDPGEGYLFAVTSTLPFRYHEIVTGARWDYRYVAYDGRIVGDPYVALMDLVDVIVPANYDGYDYDIVPYYVGHQYEYPRFLCYDCHSYVRYASWDPYDRACYEFRVIAYDDPYYYPARHYAPTRVVFTRPKRLEPRYVFVKRTERAPDVVVKPQHPTPKDRGAASPGWTSRDVGGVGRVPAPVTDPRPTPRRATISSPAPRVESPTPRRESPVVDNRRPAPPASQPGTPRRQPLPAVTSDSVPARRGGAAVGTPARRGDDKPAAAPGTSQPRRAPTVTEGTPTAARATPARATPAAPSQEPKRMGADSTASQPKPILRRRPDLD